MYSDEHKIFLKRIKFKRNLVIVYQLLILITFIFLWQYMSDNGIINKFIGSSPKLVIDTIIGLYKSGDLFNHIYVTCWETFISFMIATIAGTIIASIFWFFPTLNKIVDPYLTILNSLPKVALGPIIIIWAGARVTSIIIMALFISLIITIINVYQGFVNTDKNKVKLLKSLKATKWQIYKYLIFPSSIGSIMNALKVNISMSLIGLLPPVRENFIV